jgi:transposase, IS5 family
VVLRLLILKHVRNWSDDVLEREVRANLVYRDFTRVGGAKMPDAKTMGRWGLALGPQVIKQIHERMVRIAQAKLRDRSRSVKLRALAIARAARAKGKQSQGKLARAYANLLNSTSRLVGQAKRFSKEVAEGIKRSTDIVKQLRLEGLRQDIDAMVPRIKQVMK